MSTSKFRDMEEKVTFNEFSDKRSISIMDESGQVPLAEISGYDLDIVFNMREINSIEEAEEACGAMAEALFRMMFQQLLEESKQTD